jgi:hypothetical protein
MPDGNSISGVGEVGIKSVLGQVVQFERVGFSKLQDNFENNCIEAVFAHK